MTRLATPTNTQLKVDVASPTTIYVGEAAPGASTSSAVWKIFQVDTTTGVSLGFANKLGEYKFIWDDRTTYTYG